jgi:hypothetical protein
LVGSCSDFLEEQILLKPGRIAVNKNMSASGYVKKLFLYTYKGRKEINTYIKGQAQPGPKYWRC